MEKHYEEGLTAPGGWLNHVIVLNREREFIEAYVARKCIDGSGRRGPRPCPHRPFRNSRDRGANPRSVSCAGSCWTFPPGKERSRRGSPKRVFPCRLAICIPRFSGWRTSKCAAAISPGVLPYNDGEFQYITCLKASEHIEESRTRRFAKFARPARARRAVGDQRA